MHIAAFKAACEVWDLDHYAKHALEMICGHIEYPATWTQVPIRRLAIDMNVHYDTARQAVSRAVHAGYLAVEKVPGQSSRIRLNADRLLATSRPRTANHLAAQDREPPRGLDREPFAAQDRELEESLDKNRRNGSHRAGTDGRAGDPVEKLALARHPRDCVCRGTGWVDHTEVNGVIRCDALDAAIADTKRRQPSHRPT